MLTLVLADCDMKVEPKAIDSLKSYPELVHFSLLLANDSCLAEVRELKTIVHTRYGKIFWFEPDVKIPDDLEGFKKLLADAVTGNPPKGVIYEKGHLRDILELEMGNRVAMSPDGDREDLFEYFTRAEDYVVVIGGFKEGDFISPVYDWAEKNISIYENLKKTWSVTAEVLSAYNNCSIE